MKFRIRIFWIGILLALNPAWGSDLAPAWEQAIQSYQSGQPEKAATEFEEWIAMASEQGIRSFEAHYNAGLSHGYASHAPEAALHFVRASRLTLSPFKVSTVQRQLAKIQRELGIQESLLSDFAFTVRFYLNPSTLVALAAVCLWSLLLSLTLAFRTREKAAWALFVGVALFATGIGATVGLTLGGKRRFGLVQGLSPVTVTEDDGEKLLELPPGTLVSYTREPGEKLRILSPISGYAPPASVSDLPL